MLSDILLILVVAFGLFAVCMFVLFYVYIRKHYNDKHITDDYKKDLDREERFSEEGNTESSDEIVPKRKK